jgi:glycosyltransferase involved in cell wall biosynthesis
MTEHRISIIVPVFNAAPFVRQAVESALAQPETCEVVIVEDGSPDGSLEICRQLAAEDGRVRLYRHPGGTNRGCPASRNLGIEKARLDRIAFLDADDYYLPGRFRTAASILDRDKEVDGVYETIGTELADEAARARWTEGKDKWLLGLSEAVPPERLFETLLDGARGCFSPDGLTVRKALLGRTGGYDVHLDLAEDTAMHVKMSAVGRLVAGEIERPVAMRRMHRANRCTQSRERLLDFHAVMGRTLLAWGMRQRLDADKLNLLVRYWLHASEWPDRRLPWRLRKAKLAARAVGLAMAHPRVSGFPHWRESLKESFRDAFWRGGGETARTDGKRRPDRESPHPGVPRRCR